MMKIALFVFRRDLRLHDNRALNQALEQSERVIPVFIMDPRQLRPHPYHSNKALDVMLDSLADLEMELQSKGANLVLRKGDPALEILQLCHEVKAEAVFVNRDYTPFSRLRDQEISEALNAAKIPFYALDDLLLVPPEQACKSDGRPYTVFSPFYKANREKLQSLPLPLSKPASLWSPRPYSLATVLAQAGLSRKTPLQAGRAKAMEILSHMEDLSEYARDRDIPSIQGTSRLSAHLKFGTVSVREVYHRIGSKLSYDHPLIRQLFWRDFYTHIAYHFPDVFGKSFHGRYDGLKWSRDEEAFKRWQDGTTGFPIVDAGMRELAATGFMHNRVRMITASFLLKDLHIDWRWGERFFACSLNDYDPCVNNGNWQWVASTGCDPQPWFRIFNPWLQQKKFDPECLYIKLWIPELLNVSAKGIHHWKGSPGTAYPAPMLDHALESALSKAAYAAVARPESTPG